MTVPVTVTTMTANSKRTLWVLTLILLAAAALRVLLIADQGFWFDELFGVYYARFPLLEMYRGIALEGTKMPLFYTLIHAALPPNNIELTLRLLAAAFGLLSIAVMYRLVRRLIAQPQALAIWATLLLAINPFHLHYSREARPYTLMLLWALLAMWAFSALTKRGGRVWWLVLGVSHALLFITNLFGLLIPFVQFVYLATHLRRHNHLLLRWLFTNALTVIPLAAWYGYMYMVNSGQLRFAASWFPVSTPADLLYTFWNFTLGYLPELTPVLAVELVLMAALAILGAVWLRRQRLDLALIWLLPILLVWLVGTRRPLYGDRYLIVIMPALVVLIAAGIMALRQPLIRRVTGAFAIIFMLVGCWQIVANPENRREEWREAAALIRRQQQSGEAIYVKEVNVAISLGFYYADTSSGGEKVALPIRQVPADTTFDTTFDITFSEPQFWIVIGYAEFSPHRLGQAYLMDWDARRAQFEQEWGIPAAAQVVDVDILAGVVIVKYQLPV